MKSNMFLVVKILFHQSAVLFVKIPIQKTLKLICKTKVVHITRIHFSETAQQITSLSILLESLDVWKFCTWTQNCMYCFETNTILLRKTRNKFPWICMNCFAFNDSYSSPKYIFHIHNTNQFLQFHPKSTTQLLADTSQTLESSW